jgi:hypothetical protein
VPGLHRNCSTLNCEQPLRCVHCMNKLVIRAASANCLFSICVCRLRGSVSGYMPADCFSFGVILWELLTRLRPVIGYTARPHNGILNIVPFFAQSGRRPSFPSAGCPPAWRSLCEECWGQVPSDRPVFDAALVERLENLAVAARVEAWPVPASPCDIEYPTGEPAT